MLDSVPAHVELVQRHNILRVVVADAAVCAELALDRFLGGKQIADLNIQLLALLVAHEVDLFIAGSSDCHLVIAAQKLKVSYSEGSSFYLSLHWLRGDGHSIKLGLKLFTKNVRQRSSNSNPVLV